jgi:ANTAR domain
MGSDREPTVRQAPTGPRQAPADERDRQADLREQTADERDRQADLREQTADERDRLADERDAKADLRDRELLMNSALARLQARLETMPVIEQAKGVIMEQEGCTAEQAFDLLRKASQSSNVPIRELAVLIVTRKNYTAPDQRPSRSR